MKKSQRYPVTVSVVLSFYNEASVLNELLNRLRLTFERLKTEKIVSDYELIFINDASTDSSEDILRKEMERGDIVLINMSRNFGVTECAMAGFRHSQGDAVIYMDADLQDPPELIPDLISAWQEDQAVEVVFTTRSDRLGESKLKMLITKFGYRLINSISDIDLHVDSGDFKLLSRTVVNILDSLPEDKPYMRGLINWVGFKQKQVFYTRDKRFDGAKNTKMPVLSRKVIYYWLDRALISFSDAPLKIVLFLGFALSLISMLYIVVVVYQKLAGIALPGFSAIISAVLMLGSFNLLTLGFVGLYIGAIFREVKQRPPYIIKEVVAIKRMKDNLS